MRRRSEVFETSEALADPRYTHLTSRISLDFPMIMRPHPHCFMLFVALMLSPARDIEDLLRRP